MNAFDPNPEKTAREEATRLLTGRRDFAGTYMSVANLELLFHHHPQTGSRQMVAGLHSVLKGQEHAGQRQAFFLYRKTANLLRDIILNSGRQGVARQAHQTLRGLLGSTTGPAFRSAAEALGALPATTGTETVTPALPASDIPLPSIGWADLLGRAGLPADAPHHRKGRNLVLNIPGTDRILNIKTALSNEQKKLLGGEGVWMIHLAAIWPTICRHPQIFHIPEPLAVNGQHLFQIPDLPAAAKRLTRPAYSMAFISHRDYFCYPNAPTATGTLLPPGKLVKILGHSAFILGRLASRGIVHTALIPLFHNRVQRRRRNDRGVYQWHRGGRLDQWLTSCQYPNIGQTGIRDFEHFIRTPDSGRNFYERIGGQILSLSLILGSYFRCRDLSRTGRNPDGSAVDMRDQFAPDLIKTALAVIFRNYYRGFTENNSNGHPPVNLDRLTPRLIEEMGTDKHMEEILRAPEQEAMTQKEFAEFLGQRGYFPEAIAKLKKGARDIAILTGPHLGAFNNRFSLPELTEFTAATAAVCIADRYRHIHLDGAGQ